MLSYTAYGLKLVIVSIIVFGTLVTAGDLCPDKEDIAPCICRDGDTEPVTDESFTTGLPSVHVQLEQSTPPALYVAPRTQTNNSMYTIVECKEGTSVLLLDKSIKVGFHKKSIDELNLVTVLPPLEDQKFVRLPENWLEYTRVKQITIQKTFLHGSFISSGNPFKGQEKNLVKLSATNCFLYGSLTYDTPGTINTKGLEQLPYLEVLNFSMNFLVVITASSFKNPPKNLSHVDFSHNSIEIIETGAFALVTNLRVINLSHNQIQNFRTDIFSTTSKRLEEIDLSSNNIKDFPANFFVNMSELKIVKLQHNLLNSLPENTWAIIWKKLHFVNLEGNFLECNCDLLWMLKNLNPPQDQIVLGGCSKTTAPFYLKFRALSQLTRFDLNCDA